MKKKKSDTFLIRRISACIIDYLLILIFIVVLLFFYGTSDGEGGYSLDGLPALSVFIFWGIITIGMEQLLGMTIGNYLNKIKPISIVNYQDKERISFSQSIKRHLLDVVDMSFLGLTGIIVIKNTKKHQRLGDLWAKTIVVSLNK